MKKIISQFLIAATSFVFVQGVFASTLTYHANTLAPSPGDIVQYSLVAQVPHGKPRNCRVTFSFPADMTYVRNSGTGGGGGGSSQSLSCSGSQCTWDLTHVHNVNGHVEIYLRVSNGISGTISAPTVSGSGCGFPATVPYVDPGAGGCATIRAPPPVT